MADDSINGGTLGLPAVPESRPERYRVARHPALDIRSNAAHTRRMAETTDPFGAPRATLLDARGTGLRMTWHPDEGVAVLSLWREDRCIGTFRAGPTDMAGVISYLSEVLATAAAHPSGRLADTA